MLCYRSLAAVCGVQMNRQMGEVVVRQIQKPHHALTHLLLRCGAAKSRATSASCSRKQSLRAIALSYNEQQPSMGITAILLPKKMFGMIVVSLNAKINNKWSALNIGCCSVKPNPYAAPVRIHLKSVQATG
eukprot:5430254-Amphidinium_carterae.1